MQDFYTSDPFDPSSERWRRFRHRAYGIIAGLVLLAALVLPPAGWFLSLFKSF